MSQVRAHVVRAEITLSEGCDPASIGAAVTTELCGHWEHEGACRWPHNNAIDASRTPARFRTIFVATDADTSLVLARIEAALRGPASWTASNVRPGGIEPHDRYVAQRLTTGPRLQPE
jgi:hypothetical protein